MGERTRELLILITGDIIIFILSIWLTLSLRYFGIPEYDLLTAHFGPFLIMTAVWLCVFYVAGLYDKHTMLLKSLLFRRILNTQVVNMIFAALLFLVIDFGIAPKTNLIIYMIISSLLIVGWRLYLFNYFSPKQRHRAILIADGPEAVELVDEINNNDRYNYSFVRIIDESTLTKTEDFEQKLRALLEREQVRVIVANPRGDSIKKFLPVLFDLSFMRFAFTFLDFNRLYGDTFDRMAMGTLEYEWFIHNISQSRSVIYDVVKRWFDVIGAVLLFVVMLPVMLCVAIAIKIDDRGELIYTADRVGQFNKYFKLYKFRTKNGSDTGEAALKSTLVDTRVGGFLRKTRLDELPQLLNVIKGDMSFIGPRPELPALAEVYTKEVPYYNTRHFLKPGLSGWAQIKNFDVPRGGIDVERTTKKVSYDLFYLERRSLILDVQIALKTLATIVMRTGT